MSERSIEVEYRAMMSEEKYHALITFLNTNAKDLGEDDKSIHFFILPDKLLKVTDNISQGTAKITLKLNRIGNGAMFEEIEIPIARGDVPKASQMFEALGFDNLTEPIVRRHNYVYKEVELAVKYSKTWGYHAELEIMIGDPGEQAAAEAKIRAVSSELGLTLMTEPELAAFVKEVEDANKKSKEK